MEKRFLRLPRRVLATIIMAAAALMLIRPVCELWHAGGAANASELLTASTSDETAGASEHVALPCCPDAGDRGVISVVQAAAFGNPFDSVPLAPPFVPIAAILVTFALQAIPWRRALPRTPRSFYLRSARILR